MATLQRETSVCYWCSARKMMSQFKLLMKVQLWICCSYMLHFLQQHQMTAMLGSSRVK